MVHSYDNEIFYNEISCKDYLTYQLVYIQKKVNTAIKYAQINEHKFDMRIYVLVTGITPLKIYVYREGLTRLAAENYFKKCEEIDPNKSEALIQLSKLYQSKGEKAKANEYLDKAD